MYNEITSRENENLKFAAKLLKSSKYRSDMEQFIIENIKNCHEIVTCGVKILKCFFDTEILKKSFSDPILSEILEFSEEKFLISRKLLNLISDVESPQGIVCVCKKIKEIYDISQCKNIVILDRIQNPDNLGSIFRSCAAFSTDLVVLTSGSCDVYNPKVLRASAGGIFYTKFCENADLSEFIKVLHENNFKILALDASDGAISLNRLKKYEKTAILLGNEGRGLHELDIQQCDEKVVIPMTNNFESLNVAVAAGIAIYSLFGLTNF